jgi:hypothetical protein
LVAQQKTADSLTASVQDTFSVLGWEIELAGARCIFLDKMIGELMHSVPPEQREKLLEGMHVVDLLSQHLTCLSSFARKLSEDAESSSSLAVDAALGEITLGALAERMRTAFGAPEDGAESADSGDFDLF